MGKKKTTPDRDRLDACAWAAHKRGMTYGEFMSTATEKEIEEAQELWKKDKKEREHLIYLNAMRKWGGAT